MKENFSTGRNLRIAVSSYCNLDCAYCGGHKGYSNEKRGTMEDYRREAIDGYKITLNEIKELLKLFYSVGYRGVSLTGGEPMVNKEWYEIISYAKELGFLRRELTTNGVLLGDYIKKNGYPTDLTLIKVSFDTIDREVFKKITKKDNFDKVVDSIKIASKKIETRANRVVLKSELEDLDEFLKYCRSIGFSSANLLDLAYYPNRRVESERGYFEKEYVAASEIKQYLEEHKGYQFERGKYGYQSVNDGKFRIIIKESRLTLRDEQCESCPIYCQEGKYTTRIATDGNITMCPDCYCEIDSLSGRELLNGLKGIEELQKLYNSIDQAEEKDTFDQFVKKYELKIGR